jgi:hypothetical protein
LSLRAPTQRIRAEIDFIIIVVKPEDTVTVDFELEIVKARRIGTEEFKHLARGKHRPQINDTGKAILPDDLDDAEYDRFCTMHGDYVSHGTLSVTA